MHAGELFVCVICNEEHNQEEAKLDAQLQGPVCQECSRNAKWAVAWMKREGIDRPMVRGDIKEWNHKRFMP